jgi:hypothetical protein
VKPSADERLTDHVGIGVLTSLFPPGLVDALVEARGRREQRSRLAPARVAVYFTLALALFSDASYGEVARQLAGGLEWESGWARRWSVPGKSSLFRARRRLGAGVLEDLFREVARPLAERGAAGAWLAGRRLVAVDGTVLDVPDTPENAAEFGRHGSKDGTVTAFPQVRVVALGECATLAELGAVVGGCQEPEVALARGLLGGLDASMALVADRSFYSYDLWRDAAETGCALVWRVKGNMVLPVLEELADGSYLSRIRPSDRARRRAGESAAVRVVEYAVEDGDAAPASYRLITNLLDPTEAPARDIAEAYHLRWRIETAFDELKSHERSPGVALRSKSPDLVRQEVWAYLCVHYAIRWLIASALAHSGASPDRGSFTAALRASRRSVITHQGFSPLRAG